VIATADNAVHRESLFYWRRTSSRKLINYRSRI